MVTRPSRLFLVTLASAALLLAMAVPATGVSRSFTLTAILYSDPNWKTPLGTLDLRLSQSIGDPNLYEAMGEARFGGGADGYTALLITGPDGAEISWGDPNQSNGIVTFRLATVITADVATRMIGDPNLFIATLYVEGTPVGSGPLMYAPSFERKR
jgi:hypothetical protein